MAYTSKNFKTKKELKAAVAARVAFLKASERWEIESILVLPPQPVTCYQPNGDITGASVPRDGTVVLEGPHYPEPHRWYAQGTMKDGELVAVK